MSETESVGKTDADNEYRNRIFTPLWETIEKLAKLGVDVVTIQLHVPHGEELEQIRRNARTSAFGHGMTIGLALPDMTAHEHRLHEVE